MTKEKFAEFIDKLTKLSNEYNLAIGGCGCCGSPFVFGINGTKGSFVENLDYDEKIGCYTFSEDTNFKDLK